MRPTYVSMYGPWYEGDLQGQQASCNFFSSIQVKAQFSFDNKTMKCFLVIDILSMIRTILTSVYQIPQYALLKSLAVLCYTSNRVHERIYILIFQTHVLHLMEIHCNTCPVHRFCGSLLLFHYFVDLFISTNNCTKSVMTLLKSNILT